MDEGRKKIIGLMASILGARMLAQLENIRPSPVQSCIIADAVTLAERIMGRIDSVFASGKQG
jgi:hypothetical protein